MTPPTSKEMVEIFRLNLTIDKNDRDYNELEKKLENKIEKWNSSVEDILECCYDDLVDYRNYIHYIVYYLYTIKYS